MPKTLKSTSTNLRRKPIARVIQDHVSESIQSVTSTTVPPTSQLNSDLVSHSSSQFTAATKKKVKKPASAIKPKKPKITKDSTQEEGSISGNQTYDHVDVMEEPMPDLELKLINL